MKKLTLNLMACAIVLFGALSMSAQVSTFPYLEDFEGGAGGWTTGGTSNSWQLGTPAGTNITSASSGTNAWATNLTGTYNAGETSHVQQSFDFTSLVAPRLSMSVYWDSEASWDGGNVSYSIDGGTTFTPLGAIGSGANWYNDATIAGLNGSGSQVGWTFQQGAGGSDAWVTAEQDMFFLAGEAAVIIRVNFGADGSFQLGDGLAFDDFAVSDVTCPEITAIGVSNITNVSADFDWTLNVPIVTTYEVSVADGTGPIAGYPLTGQTQAAVSLTGLAANTEYTITILPECTGGVSVDQSFFTLGCDQTDPLVSCTYNLQLSDFGDGTAGSADGWPADGVITVTAGNQVTTYTIAPGTYDPANAGPPNPARLNVVITACAGELLTVEYSGSTGDEQDVWELTGPGGLAFNGTTQDGSGFSGAACPTCSAPSAIVSSSVCEDAVDLAWTNSAPYDSVTVSLSWGPALVFLQYSADTTIVGNVTSLDWDNIIGSRSNPALPGQAPGLNTVVTATVTGYCAPATALDPVEQSSVSTTYTGPACNCADQCVYEIEVVDSFGDGWEDGGVINSTNINVSIDGIAVDSIWPISAGPTGAQGGPDFLSVQACPGANIEFFLTDGPTGTDSEIRFRITNLTNGQELLNTLAGNGGLSGSQLLYSEATCPTCIAPASIDVTTIGPDTARIAWPVDPLALSADIFVVLAGDPAGTGVNVTDTTYLAMGLDSGTEYDVYLSNVCAAGPSDTVLLGGFTTESDYCGGDLFLDDGGATGVYSANSNITTTICPDTPGDVVQVTFTEFVFEDRSATLCWDGLAVFEGATTAGLPITPASTGLGTSTGNFCWDVTSGTGNLTGYTIVSTDASGCLTFRQTSDGSGQRAGFQATVVCGPAPTCIAPSAVVTSNITQDAVDVAWTDNNATAPASDFEIEYVLAGAAQDGTNILPGQTSPATVTGLTPSTAYDLYVRADCGATDGVSPWSLAATITTLDACEAPFNFTVSAIGADSALITWESVDVDATSFNYEVELDGVAQDAVGVINTVDTFAVLTGLAAETAFDVYLWADCGAFGASDTLGAVSFTTTATCPPVTGLTVSNETTEGADIDWVDSPGNDVDQWLVAIDTAGLGYEVADEVLVTAHPYTATGFASNTAFDVYVREICMTGDTSDVVGPVSFTTAADYCGGDVFTDNGGAAGNYLTNSSQEVTICPDNAGDIVSVTFTSFEVEANGTGCWDNFFIFDGASVGATAITPLSTGLGTGTGGFCADAAAAGTGSLLGATILSSDASGCLTFRLDSDGSVPRAGFTADVVCAPPPSCFDPTAFAVDSVGSNGVRLTWTDNNAPTLDGYSIEIVPAATANTGAWNAINQTSPATITGLTPSTAYDAYILADCGVTDGVSDTIGPIQFSTLESCPAVTDLVFTAAGLTTNSFELDWSSVNGVEWQILVDSTLTDITDVPPTPDFDLIATAKPYSVTGLEANTQYFFQIRSICAPGDTSDFIGPFQITTRVEAPPVPVGVVCASADAPVFVITEEFDLVGDWTGDVNQGPLNGNWSFGQTGPTGSGNTGPAAPGSGGSYVYFETSGSSPTGDGIARSPEVDLTPATAGDDVELSMLFHAFGADIGQFDVSITTDGGVTADTVYTWTEGQYQAFGGDPWVPLGIDISAYSGQVIQVQLHGRYVANFAGDLAIDQLRIAACGNFCTNPANFTCGASTTDSLSVTWTADATAASFDVEWGLTGFVPDSVAEATVTGATEFGVDGLMSSTSYDFYLKSNCAAGESEWLGPITCTTSADFCAGDQYIDNGGPTGQYLVNTNETVTICPDNAGDVVFVTFASFEVENNGATGCWDQLFVFDGDSDAATAITPFSSGLGTGTAGFCALNGTGPGDLTGQTLFSSDATGCLTFTLSSDGSVPADGFIADVVCMPLPDCWAPTDVVVDQIGLDSAIVNWTANFNQTGTFDMDSVQVFNAGDDPLVDAAVFSSLATASPVTATGLMGDTDYEAYVTTICTEGISMTTGPIAFTTDPICFPAEGIAISDIGADTAVVSWTANAEQLVPVIHYDLLVVETGVDPQVGPVIFTATDAASPVTATGLTEQTGYDVYLITDCDAGELSDTTAAVAFTTGASCLSPTGLTVFAPTTDGGSLNWTDANVGGSVSFEVFAVARDSAFAQAVSVGTPTAAPFVITGLDAATAYDLYVVADCGATQSPEAGPIALTTLIEGPVGVDCTPDASTVVYSNELDAPGALTLADNGGNVWQFGSSTTSGGTGPLAPQSGTGFMFFEASGVAAGDSATATTAVIDLSSATIDAEMSFLLHAVGGDLGTFQVNVISGGVSTTEFTYSGAVQAAQADAFVPVGINLAAYIGQSIVIEFFTTGNTGFEADWAIDLLEVEACGDFCLPAANLACGASTINSLEVTWTGDASNVNYDLEIVAAGATPTGTPTVLGETGTSYTFTGLTSATSYDVYVRANCAAATTDFVGPVTCATSLDYCNGAQLIDNGGTGGNYANNTNETTVICANNASDVVQLTFSEFNTEAGWDFLTLFDGPDVSSTQIGVFDGTDIAVGQAFQATAANGGCITVLFTSDGSGQRPGYVADVACLDPTPPANDDCAGAVFVPTGVGSDCDAGVTGTLLFSTQSPQATSAECFQAAAPSDVWFKTVVPASGRIVIDFPTQPGNAMFTEVFTGDDCNLTFITGSCNGIHPKALPARGAAASELLTPGDSVYVRVWEAGNDALGDFEICINDPVPTNTDCALAVPVPVTEHGVPSWTTGNTAFALPSATACGPGDEVVFYEFVATDANMMIFARPLAGGDYDAVVEVYSEDCGASIECFDNYVGGMERVLVTGLTAGETYSYSVSHAGGAATASSDEFETGVRGFNNASLDPAYCGVFDYTLQDGIYATRDDLGDMYALSGVNVRFYSFLFEEVGGPLSVTVDQPVGIPYVQLDDVGGLVYGGTYNVSVRHTVRANVNGELIDIFSDFNAPCTIGLDGAIPTTALRPEFCPAPDDLFLDQQIQAIPVIGADRYRFQFVGGGQTLVEESNNYAVSLFNVGSGGQSLVYGGSYDVRVAVRVEGVWSPYGAVCTIGMQPQPEAIGLIGSFCGETYDFPFSDFVLAELVNGATQYQFRFTPDAPGQPVLTQFRTGISFYFHTTTLDFSAGGDYSVDVRAFAGGQWGDYGDACTITINPIGTIAPPTGDDVATKAIAGSAITVGLYPNPNEGEEVMVNLSDLDGQNQVISIEVVDLAGKTIHTNQFANKGATANFIVDFDQPLAKGMYFVNVYANDRMITEKLTVE